METMNDALAPNVLYNSPNRGLMSDKYGIDLAFFLLIIPLILISIYILLWLFPQLECIFVLQLSNPTIASIYLSNYAHVSFWHLLDNLIIYCLLIYLINTLSHYVGYGFGVLAPSLFTEPLLKIIEKWKCLGG